MTFQFNFLDSHKKKSPRATGPPAPAVQSFAKLCWRTAVTGADGMHDLPFLSRPNPCSVHALSGSAALTDAIVAVCGIAAVGGSHSR